MTSTQLQLQKNESDAIQALRFVAAFFVFIQHLFAFAHGAKPINVDWFWQLRLGEIGVGVFFVISGFIMTMKLDDDPKSFLLKRVLRIYPSYWAMILVSLVLRYTLISDGTTPRLSTIMLFPSDVSDNSNMIPSWTLVYEVFFYVLCAVLCAVRPLRKLLPFLLLAWLGAIEYHDARIGQVSNAFPVIQNIVFSRMNIYFIAGMALGLSYDKMRGSAKLWLALFLLVAAHTVFALPEIVMIMVRALSFVFLLAFLMQLSYSGTFGRFMAKLGDYSYGIYLAHMPLIYIAAKLITPHSEPLRFRAVALIIGAVTLPMAMFLAAMEFRLHSRVSKFVLRKVGRRGGAAASAGLTT